MWDRIVQAADIFQRQPFDLIPKRSQASMWRLNWTWYRLIRHPARANSAGKCAYMMRSMLERLFHSELPHGYPHIWCLTHAHRVWTLWCSTTFSHLEHRSNRVDQDQKLRKPVKPKRRLLGVDKAPSKYGIRVQNRWGTREERCEMTEAQAAGYWRNMQTVEYIYWALSCDWDDGLTVSTPFLQRLFLGTGLHLVLYFY